MTKRRGIVEDVICNLMAFAVIMFPMSLIVHTQTNDPRAAWLSLLLLPFFLLLYVMRRTIKSFWLFLPAHGVILGLPFLVNLADTDLFPTFLIFAVICIWHSCHIKVNGEPTNGEMYFIIGSIFCLVKAIAAVGFGLDSLVGLSILLEMILAAGYMALRHMKKVDMSLAVLSEARPDLDNKRILRFNNIITAGFIFFAVTIATVVPLIATTGFVRIINGILDGLRLLAAWIFSFIGFKEPEELPPQEVTAPALDTAVEGDLLTPEYEPTWLSQFFDKFMSVLVILFVVALVGGAVYVVFSNLYKSFKQQDDGDIEEKLERNTGTAVRVLRKTFLRDFGTERERKIRKLYYKTIKRQKKMTLKSTDTTNDILKKSSADITALTREYEKARYTE